LACYWIAEVPVLLDRVLSPVDWTSAVTASTLVTVAEFGDKSQLVCMTLAARHRPWPVLLGAVCAFGGLNLIAVSLGAVVAQGVPDSLISLLVAVLFIFFGIRSLWFEAEAEAMTVERSGQNIFMTAFLMLFIAEFGDKTQLAVAGLGAAAPALPVWLGATLALVLTSAIGVWAGRTVIQKIPPRALHRLSGLLFLGFGLIAALHIEPMKVWKIFQPGLTWLQSQEVASWLIR
jgi:putative Ca2+/H+ antiporter (TMEM165/GDT1 family)